MVGWINEDVYWVPDYSYLKIYKYNLKKKEVEIFDTYEYGIISNGVYEVGSYYPTYDISKDKRFLYIPARSDTEYTNEDFFYRKAVKTNGGLYIYDWWENKLYKLLEGNVTDVTNNTDDGYVYVQFMRIEDKQIIYDYYRFKNPEDIIRNQY